MDVKSLAKSKRAHTQHHSKKPHSTQKPKAPSDSSSDAGAGPKKPLSKQIREKTHQSRRISGLPSNWDRYEDEFDDLGDPAGDISSQVSDVVLPKSKGADYLHLITEAQSQSQSHSSLDCFPTLDDVLPGDFTQGVGSMLSVRGEDILSRIGNDNFIVEDRSTASHEASFLSLNLNALAEQLEKVDLPQRLFIEADLLPPELHTEGSKAKNKHESDQMQLTCTRVSEELVNGFSEKVTVAEKNTNTASPVSGYNPSNSALSDQGSDLMDQVEDVTNSSQFGESDQSRALESTGELKVNSFAEKLPTFEATAAEAELDVLLDSFNETKFLDSSGFKSGKTFPDSQKEASMPLPPSKTASATANFDDVLDDLLEETSNPMNQNNLSQPWNVKTTPHDIQSSSSHSVTKPKVLDDFDSWLDTI